MKLPSHALAVQLNCTESSGLRGLNAQLKIKGTEKRKVKTHTALFLFLFLLLLLLLLLCCAVLCCAQRLKSLRVSEPHRLTDSHC